MALLSKFNFLLNPQTFILGGIIIVMFFRFRKLLDKEEEEKSKNENTQSIPPPNQTLKLITSRRTIMPKEYTIGGKLSEDEIDLILKAANWAPTHQKTEPWRYSIISNSRKIEKYLDFLDDWYEDHLEELTDQEITTFKTKLLSVRAIWPYYISHLILIGMKRQAKPEKLLPEWEEICAVAMSVQNMHLMATSLNQVGAFWSSHTWCKSARDSAELRKKYFGGLLDDSEDRVFGAFILGTYDNNRKKFHSSRSDIKTKIVRNRISQPSEEVETHWLENQ